LGLIYFEGGTPRDPKHVEHLMGVYESLHSITNALSLLLRVAHYISVQNWKHQMLALH
jgi:hypothetical protein